MMNRREFLNWLYEYCEEGQVETRALPKTKQAFHDRGDWDSIDRFCKAHHQQNLYFAVGTRDGGGTKEHIVEVPSVWADIDFKDFADKATAKRTIYEFPLKPSVMLETGGGYQAHWRLKEPAVKEEIPELEKILKGIARILGADSSATDASRILRLPETINYKYKNKPAVKVVWDNRDLEYNPQDFETYLSLYKLEIVGAQGALPTAGSYENEENCGTERHTAAQNGTERDTFDFSIGHHDETLFSLAWRLAKGGTSQADVLKAIEYIAETLDPGNETKRWARDKTRSAFARLEGQQRNLSEEIRDFIRHTSGTFTAQEVDKELDIGTKRHKHNRKTVLLRLLKEEIIERVGGRNSTYRRIESTCDEIDPIHAPTDEINLILPLGLSDHFKAYRKNIIIFAGDQDSGKTALLLNIIKDNMDQHDIQYFSSEMAGTEMRVRLELFPDIKLQDWKFSAWERSDNFADVIKPDAINLIDYLEIDDHFYNVGGKLKAIHNKLQNGIAIIALQKTPGKDIGRGGSFSAEKPRLYVSISNDYPGHTAKIIKCKNWRTSDNPNGLTKHFKLYQGHSIVETTKWQRNEDK
jgi:hypothetical protein